MPPPKRPLIEARRDQMFPTLEPAEVDRLRRFGEPRSYRAGDALVKVGEVGHGLTVVLAGEVAITRRDEFGHREAIVTHGPGAFMGERAVLEGGRRTATLRAATACKVAQARKVELDLTKLAQISEGHHREDAVSAC